MSSLLIAKFHYTGPTGPDQTKSADFVGDPGLRPGSREKVRAGQCGSGRARVVEFSYYFVPGVDLRRRVRERFVDAQAVRRSYAGGAQRPRRRLDAVSRRSARLPVARHRLRGTWQRRPARPTARSALGPRPHRPVRRKPATGQY